MVWQAEAADDRAGPEPAGDVGVAGQDGLNLSRAYAALVGEIA